MNRSKIIEAIMFSLVIIISSTAIANFIGHRLYPTETTENSEL